MYKHYINPFTSLFLGANKNKNIYVILYNHYSCSAVITDIQFYYFNLKLNYHKTVGSHIKHEDVLCVAYFTYLVMIVHF
jgi:hypothetical protein